MGFLSHYTGTERIDVTPDGCDVESYWVDLKKHLTGDEYDTAKRALTSVKVQTTGAGKDRDTEIVPEPDVASYQNELLVASIIAWNLTDADDQLLPLEPIEAKRKSVGALPEAVRAELLLRVNEFNEPRSAQERTSFPDAAPRSAVGG